MILFFFSHRAEGGGWVTLPCTLRLRKRLIPPHDCDDFLDIHDHFLDIHGGFYLIETSPRSI